MSEAKARDNSRLEQDDPYYCKRCGWELPDMCVNDGWHPLGGDESPEICGKCAAEVMFE